MKRILSSLVVVAVAAWPFAALAGGNDAYRCTNACPLAKQANQHRATGAESVGLAETVRRDVAKRVAENLDRI